MIVMTDFHNNMIKSKQPALVKSLYSNLFGTGFSTMGNSHSSHSPVAILVDIGSLPRSNMERGKIWPRHMCQRIHHTALSGLIDGCLYGATTSTLACQ